MEDLDVLDEEAELNEMPKGMEPLEWYKYFADRGGELPRAVTLALARQYRNYENPRDTSIAKFLKGRINLA